MKRTEVLQETQKMRFESIYNQRLEEKLSVEEVAALLGGVHEQTFRRWQKRYDEEGAIGFGRSTPREISA